MISEHCQQNKTYVLEPKIGKYNWLKRKGSKSEMWKPIREIKRESEEEDSSLSEEEDYYEIYNQPSKYYEEDWPPDFWKVKKLTSNLRKENPTQTSLVLMCLRTCDFSDPITVQAIKDNNELSVIMNLLTCGDIRVQITALSCLTELACIKNIRYEIVYFGGLEDMVPLLAEPSLELRMAAANAIATIAVFHRARKIVRSCNGIPLLANLLFHAYKHLKNPPRKRNEEEDHARIKAATAAANALSVLCEDKKNKKIFWKCGALHPCAYIVSSNVSIQLLSAVIGLIQTCAAKKYFRTAIRDMGVLQSIRRHLHSDDRHLTQICAQAVFKCAKDIRSSELFGEAGFLEKIYEITVNKENHGDEELMSSLTGALWKCMKSSLNVGLLHKHGAIPTLLSLLSTNFGRVHVHIVGCLALCFRHRPSCQDIVKHNGVEILAQMLNTTHGDLIVNLSRAIAEASYDPVCMELFEKYGTVENVWSHLRNNDPWVASNAAWSLCPILINMKDTSACVRSLIGAIEVIVKLLISPYTRISTPACKIVAILAQRKENLSLLTDYGVARLLSEKVTTKCKRLRYYLCMAIYTCCPSKDNAQEFARDPVLNSFLKMLRSKYIEVRVAACRVLWRLSAIPRCCLMIYENKKTLNILLSLLGNENAQEWAAGIIQNIRLFSLVQERNLTDFLEHNILKRRKDMVSVRNDFPLSAERERAISTLEERGIIAWPLKQGF